MVLTTLDARAKILTTLSMLVICVTTPADHFASFLGYFALALTLAFLGRISVRHLATRLAVAVPFLAAFALFIPFLHAPGGGYNLALTRSEITSALSAVAPGLLIFWNVAAKCLFGILIVTLLTETTPFPDLLHGLARLHCPRLLLMLASFIYRYATVLADEFRRMRRACECRLYQGRWLWQARVLGRLVGMLFLRSYERGERVYLAMVSRGYHGQIHTGSPQKERRADWLYAASAMSLFLIFRVATI